MGNNKYQPAVGDVFLGKYNDEKTRFFYGGEKEGSAFHIPKYYFAEGEHIGDQIAPRDTYDVHPTSLVANLGTEKWGQVVAMPSVGQKQAKLEELLDGCEKPQPQKSGFRLDIGRIFGRSS